MTLRVLHVDDDLTILDRVQHIFASEKIHGESVHLVSVDTPELFMSALFNEPKFQIVIIDIHIANHELNGVELAAKARSKLPRAAIIMMSSVMDAKIIGSSLKAGADDFIEKGVASKDLILRIEAVIEAERHASHASNQSKPRKDDSVHIGQTMTSIRSRIDAIAKSAINCVYVEGESGTGKEVVADLFSGALDTGVPFIRLNCGSIAPTLIASELFGHVKGSFTGAQSDKMGLIESASGGWIFLDEVATLPMDAQVSLLRAIDNQSVRRVGANAERAVSFRVVSATNEPLQDLVANGKFRKDLWQRLREAEIYLPPLRERRSEIPALVNHFLATMRGGPYTLAPTVMEALKAYDWHEGNVRELRNALRAMTEKAVGSTLTPRSIPDRIWLKLNLSKDLSQPQTAPHISLSSEAHSSSSLTVSWNGERPNFETLELLMLLNLMKKEAEADGSLSIRTLSKNLGIPKSTLSTKIRELVEAGLASNQELSEIIKSRA